MKTDLKVIQQIEFVGQLKKPDANDNATDVEDNGQSMFVWKFLENIKKTRLKFYQGRVTVL